MNYEIGDKVWLISINYSPDADEDIEDPEITTPWAAEIFYTDKDAVLELREVLEGDNSYGRILHKYKRQLYPSRQAATRAYLQVLDSKIEHYQAKLEELRDIRRAWHNVDASLIED